MLTKAQMEEKAKEIYLAKYGAMGGRWELVETKDVWRQMAVDWFNCDEGTRATFEGDLR
jgi:hypothetical protein